MYKLWSSRCFCLNIIVFIFMFDPFLSYGREEAGARTVQEAAGAVKSAPMDTFPTRVEKDQSNSWCVVRPDASDSQLQDALDWACGVGTGLGNADCSAIQNGGTCYNPDTVASHASYAVNVYYQQQNRQAGSCSFAGLTQVTTQDPSSGTCLYPSSSSSLSTNITAIAPGATISVASTARIHFVPAFLFLLVMVIT